jgi:hypothetical protein
MSTVRKVVELGLTQRGEEPQQCAAIAYLAVVERGVVDRRRAVARVARVARVAASSHAPVAAAGRPTNLKLSLSWARSHRSCAWRA